MEIHYRKDADGIRIYRCYSGEASLRLPDRIEGEPVRHLAPYTFSLYKKEEEEGLCVYSERAGDDIFRQKYPLFAGDRVEEVIFPAGTKSVGAYLFYGCKNLRRISFTDKLSSLAAGILTGCKLQEARISLFNGNETSCLKELAGEVKETFTAVLCYQGREVHQSRLVFPEFYEEDIEIATARIFESHCTGSGIQYRQCFLDQRMEYERYDSLFPFAITQESKELSAEIAFARISFPFRLSGHWMEEYRAFLSRHIGSLAITMINQERLEELKCLQPLNLWQREGLDEAIEHASVLKQIEVLAYLMDVRQKLYPVTRKRYEL